MPNLNVETLGPRSAEILKRAKEAAVVSLGIIITDFFAHHAASMETGSDIGEHALKAIPSALVPAQVSDDLIGQRSRALDLTVDIAPLTISSILAKGTNMSTKEMATLALSAQVLATATDMGAVEGHMLNRAELAQKDVGTSAVTVAFFSKWLFDKIARTEDEKKRRAWQVVTAVFAGAVTVGAAYLDSKNFSTDIASHGSAVAAGAGASALTNRNEDLANDAAAEAFAS